MELEDFYLLGHSFGGYVTGHYAIQYPKHVKKLFLVSPVGLRVSKPGEFNNWKERYEKRHREKDPSKPTKGAPKWVRPMIASVWGAKMSPFGVCRFLG